MITDSSRTHFLVALLMAATSLLPGALSAQDSVAATRDAAVAPAVGSPVPPAVSIASAPRMMSRVAWSPFVEAARNPAFEAVVLQDRVRSRTNLAMMGVGGAALVVGLLMNSDTGMIIATTGAVIGLVGFWRYLQ